MGVLGWPAGRRSGVAGVKPANPNSHGMAGTTRLERRLDRAVARATTPRGAAIVIATVSTVMTVAAGVLVTLVDDEELSVHRVRALVGRPDGHDRRVWRQRPHESRRTARRRGRHALGDRLPNGDHRGDHEHVRGALAARAERPRMPRLRWRSSSVSSTAGSHASRPRWAVPRRRSARWKSARPVELRPPGAHRCDDMSRRRTWTRSSSTLAARPAPDRSRTPRSMPPSQRRSHS